IVKGWQDTKIRTCRGDYDGARVENRGDEGEVSPTGVGLPLSSRKPAHRIACPSGCGERSSQAGAGKPEEFAVLEGSEKSTTKNLDRKMADRKMETECLR